MLLPTSLRTAPLLLLVPPTCIPVRPLPMRLRCSHHPVHHLYCLFVPPVQTVKYNSKKRAGRGFTLEELKVRLGSERKK